jgi:hypothetical protein
MSLTFANYLNRLSSKLFCQSLYLHAKLVDGLTKDIHLVVHVACSHSAIIIWWDNESPK